MTSGHSTSSKTTQTHHDGKAAQDLPWPARPPGAFLQLDVLERFDLTQSELAQRLGVSRRIVNEIINTRRALSLDVAMRLAKLTRTKATYWLNLQMQYDVSQAQREETQQYPEIDPLI